MSADPLSGDLANPQSLNKFAYVMNNPVNAVDRYGLLACGFSAEFQESCSTYGGFGSTGLTDGANCIYIVTTTWDPNTNTLTDNTQIACVGGSRIPLNPGIPITGGPGNDSHGNPIVTISSTLPPLPPPCVPTNEDHRKANGCLVGAGFTVATSTLTFGAIDPRDPFGSALDVASKIGEFLQDPAKVLGTMASVQMSASNTQKIVAGAQKVGGVVAKFAAALSVAKGVYDGGKYFKQEAEAGNCGRFY